MEKKITKRENINALLAMTEVQANENVVAYLKNELALLDKKNASRKNELSATQKENLIIKDKVLEFLIEKQNEMSCSAIAKELGYSTQKLTPILTKLVNDGSVVKAKTKGTNYYKSI